MKNKNALIRTFTFDFKCFAQMLPQFLVIVVLFTFMMSMTNSMLPTYIVTLFMSVIPLTMTMQRYTAYFGQTVGYGITRRSFILGGLLMKPVYMLLAALALIIAVSLDGSGLDMPAQVLLGALLALIGSCLGDLIGSLMLKLGRVGMVIYFVVYFGTFATLGGIGGYVAEGGVDTAFGINSPLLLMISLIAVTLLALAVLVPWLLVRRIEVR